MELPGRQLPEEKTESPPDLRPLLRRLLVRLEEMAAAMEKYQLAEYLEMTRRPARMLWINFFAGLARGMGMAIGFTLLGALVVYILQKVVVLNLPLISNFIAEIVKMVQSHMLLQPF